MTGFVFAALGLAVAALALLLRPLWLPARFRDDSAATSSRSEVNAAVYRDEFRKLDDDLAAGLLDAQTHARSREELERRALEDIPVQSADTRSRAPRATLAGLALVLPLVAAGLYAYLGHPESVSPSPHSDTAGVSSAEVEKMVAALAARLQANPDNPKGWVMLARSYKVMGRLPEAEAAYDRAASFIEKDAQELATYADIAATNAGGRLAGKPQALIKKALAADPQNPMAMWLSGSVAMEAGDGEGAARAWEALVALLPPDSDDARELKAAIAQARGLPAPSPALKAAVASPAAAATVAAAPSAASVAGTVAIDAAVAGKVKPEDTVMVVARAPGRPMPVAVLRVRVADLPLPFKLDDSMAMTPESRISTFPIVELEARVSRSGQAKPQPGDLYSVGQTVSVGASGLKLSISQVRP